GERVGRAFQLGDDVLDIGGDAGVAGKSPGGALRAGVRTLPVLYLLREGGPEADRLNAVLDGDHDNGAVGEALQLLRRSPALAEARRTAQAEVDAARAARGGGPARSDRRCPRSPPRCWPARSRGGGPASGGAADCGPGKGGRGLASMMCRRSRPRLGGETTVSMTGRESADQGGRG